VIQTCPTKLSKEEIIQSQLNDVAEQTPLDILANYYETLQIELRELPERIQTMQNATKAEQEILSGQECGDNLTESLEALQTQLRELPVHIQRLDNAIKARQKEFSSQDSQRVSTSKFAKPADRATPVPRGKTRNPMAMLRDEYKGLKLGDIAAKVLNDSPSPLTMTQLTSKIYCPLSNDEFERARNSLSTELRVGAKSDNPRWRKCGRYAYSGLHFLPEASM
jgi:hypothetical protein